MFGKKRRAITMDDLKIDVRLRHDEPVDLVDMANALISISTLAKERIGKEHGITDTKIMLNGVKEGCDIYELTFVFGAHILPLIENFNTVASFTEFIGKYIKLGGKTLDEIEHDDELTPRSAALVENIVKPIEHGNSMHVEVHGDGNHVNIFTITTDDANTIRENADLVRRISGGNSEDDVERTEYQRVLIEMHATTNSERKVRDKAYCDDILKGKAVATIIQSPDDKKTIIDDPYNNYFLVDILVNRVDGVARLYTVTKLHQVIPKDD